MRVLRKRRSGRRGYALLASLMTIGILMTLGASMAGLAGTSRRTSLRRVGSAQALNLAMGAVDVAVEAIKEDPDYAGFGSGAVGEGTVSLAVSTPAGQPDRRVLLGTATVSRSTFTVTKQVRATVSTGNVPPVFYNALASKLDFTIHGNVTVNSTPTANQGNVHSNAGLTVSGTAAEVYGSATAFGAASTSGGPTITGGMTSGVPPMAFPEVSSAFKEQAEANGVASGSVTVSNGSLIEGKRIGSLTVSGSGCRISGVVWITGNVTIDGPVTGSGTLICDGTLSLDAKFNYPASSITNIVFIITSSSAIAADLGGNRSFKGILYAPNGGVRVRGTADFMGAILASTIDLGGTPTITRITDFDFASAPVPRVFELEAWEEL